MSPCLALELPCSAWLVYKSHAATIDQLWNWRSSRQRRERDKSLCCTVRSVLSLWMNKLKEAWQVISSALSYWGCSVRLVNHLFPGHSGCSQALVNCTCCRGSRAAGLQIAIELGFERAVWLLFAHSSVAAWWLSLVLTPLSSHSVLIPRHQRWSLSIESGRFKSKHTKYFWQLCLHFHHFFKIPSNDFLCPSQLSVMVDHYMVYIRNTLDASNLRTSWEIGNFWMSDVHLDGLANRVVPKY